MKAIVYKDDLGAGVRRHRDPRRARRAGPRVPPPADRRGLALRRRAARGLHRGRELGHAPSRSGARCAPARSPSEHHARCCSARRSRTRASSRCSTRSIDYLPSPLDVPADRRASTRRPSDEAERAASLDAPFSALAFKVMSDPFVGKLTYFRVYSGKLKAGDRVLNTTTGKTERDRPHPPDAREPPRGARGDRRRRDRRRASASSRRPPATRSRRRRTRSCSSR